MITFIPNKLLLLTYFIAPKKPRRKTSQLNCFCTLEKIALIYINYPKITPGKLTLFMAYQPCRLEKLRVKSGASTIQTPQNSQIIKVSPTTTRVIMVLRDTWRGGGNGGRKQLEQTTVLVSSSRGRGGFVSPSGNLGKASVAKDGFSTRGSENLQ